MSDDLDRSDADDLDEEFDDPNLVKGATAVAVLEHVVTSIVEDPEAVEIDVDEGRRAVTLRVHVAPDDMGRVIGKRGRTAHAIRTVVRAAAARDGVEADVDFVE